MKLTDEEVDRLYSENTEEIEPIWEKLIESRQDVTTKRDAVEEWVRQKTFKGT